MGRLGFGLRLTRAARRMSAADGAPVASPPLAAIANDGWRATYPSPPDAFDPAAFPESVNLSRKGFDATGKAVSHGESCIITSRLREPYPNHATLTADQVALSDYVYATDTIAGVANNSTETSPRPIANWIMPHRLVVGDTVVLEVAAFHRDARAGEQVACVVFRVTDGMNTVSQIVSASTVSGRTGDRHAVISYKALLDISTLDDKALITCNARVFPWIGDAASVLDSADSSVAREFSPRYFLRDVALGAAPPLAYVATTGNDGTGKVDVDPVVAKASPFLTISGAFNGLQAALGASTGIDGAEIRVGNDGGTPFVLSANSATRTQKCGALTITRDPDVARANARVSFGAASFRPRLGSAATFLAPITTGCLRLADLDIVRSGASGTLLGEATAQLEVIMDDVSFDNGGFSSGWLANSHDHFYGVAFGNFGGASPLTASTYEHRIFRGVALDYNGSNLEQWLMVGCDLTSVASLQAAARTLSGSIIAFNRISKPTKNTLITAGTIEDVDGVAIVQNLIEWTTTTSGHLIGISHDSTTGDNSHVVIHCNTMAGAFTAGRVNLFYDEGPTHRISKLVSSKGNIFVQINTKSDVLHGVNEAGEDASIRTGNWAFMYGVGCAGNFSQYADA